MRISVPVDEVPNGERRAFAAILAEEITKQRRSLNDLSKECGVSASILSRFLRGKRSISLKTFERLCQVAGFQLVRF